MTDLQTSLIAIGAVIVAGVIGYNKWQEIRARKHVERAFATEQDDVLMKPAASLPDLPAEGVPVSERHEPVFSEQEFGEHAQAEPVLAPEGEDGVIAGAQMLAPEPDLPVDAMIDCVIPLSLETAVRGEKILPLLQTLRHVGSKPVHFMGLPQAAGASTDPQWGPIVHGGIYTELQAGVQLASRGSTLNELEYSEMVVRLRQIADDIGAEPDIPDMSKVMLAARSVFQFVVEHDAKLGLNVRSNGAPWEITTLLAALERQGFDVRPDGRFVMLDNNGQVLFSLTTNEPVTAEYTSRLTLLLDVPRVSLQQDGFGTMVACAKVLVKRLDGTIVDDGNQILTDPALDEIAGQVRAFCEDMQAVGIPAGSPRALRLFI